MSSVAAIVLTYNRVELLQACLEGIGRQSNPCTKIVVVDNGSTDGTADFLLRHSKLAPITIHRIEKNCGPAAGFKQAFQSGLDSGCDLLWVMDDDVIPSADALAELLRGLERLKSCDINPPYLLSVARSPDGSATNVPDVDSRKRTRGYPQWPALLHEALLPIRRGTFVSALFPRETLMVHGLPLAEMYMWGEDTEYTMRVTRKQSGFIVGRSHVEHVRAQPGSLDIRTEPDPERIALHRIYVRNLVYNSRTYLDRKRRVHTVLRILRLAAKLAMSGSPRHARVILSGLLAGMMFAPAADATTVVQPAIEQPLRSGLTAIPTQLAAIGDD